MIALYFRWRLTVGQTSGTRSRSLLSDLCATTVLAADRRVTNPWQRFFELQSERQRDLPRLPIQITPETLFHLRQKVWKCSVIGIIFAIGCRSPFGKALACEAKANLHPLAFTQSTLRHPRILHGGASDIS